MAKLPEPRPGALLKNQPNGIPVFFDRRAPRVVTADPWAFYKNAASEHLGKKDQARATAYISQAYDFYRAAENPQIGSKPLLYYYSFLNLAKVPVLVWGTSIPLRLMHGIEDPKANIKRRIRITGQQVKFKRRSNTHDQMWAELWRILGGDSSSERTVKLVDILAQVPSVHRTFTTVTKNRTRLLPIRRVDALNNGSQVWLRVTFDRHDRDVDLTLRSFRQRRDFQGALHQVTSPKDAGDASREIWFETDPEPGTRRGIETALRSLTERLFEIPCTAILTGNGYRYYFSDVRSTDWLHPAAAIYAAMFYLGSVTRYKPDVFGKLLSGGYSWVVEEFLATAPMQFIYILASVVSGSEVVRPLAGLQ
jgi:hypothetical protein